MIGAIILGAALCFLAPEFALRLRDLQCHACVDHFPLSWLPLVLAVAATVLVVFVNSIIQNMRREDRLSPNDKSQFRSEQ
jgi:hypothetical protein